MDGDKKEWKKWPPANLHKEIEDEFPDGTEPGEYCAVIVQVENPISGYIVVKKKLN